MFLLWTEWLCLVLLFSFVLMSLDCTCIFSALQYYTWCCECESIFICFVVESIHVYVCHFVCVWVYVFVCIIVKSLMILTMRWNKNMKLYETLMKFTFIMIALLKNTLQTFTQSWSDFIVAIFIVVRLSWGYNCFIVGPELSFWGTGNIYESYVREMYTSLAVRAIL